MPQKRNPISSCYIHAAVSVLRQHAAALMDAMIADHERSTGPWEIEWIVLPEAFCLLAGALKQTKFVLQGLEVDAAQMRANIDITHGLVMSEAVMMGLGRYIGREYAHDLVYDLCRVALRDRPRRCSTCSPSIPRSTSIVDRAQLAALVRSGQLPRPGRCHGRSRARQRAVGAGLAERPASQRDRRQVAVVPQSGYGSHVPPGGRALKPDSAAGVSQFTLTATVGGHREHFADSASPR